MEYALHIFNLKSKDTNAYRLVRIRSSRREQVREPHLQVLLSCTCNKWGSKKGVLSKDLVHHLKCVKYSDNSLLI